MSLLSLAKKITGKEKPSKKPSEKTAPGGKAVANAVAKKASAAPKGVAQIEIYPLVTEKGVRLQEQQVATFRVPARATKRQVIAAIESKYQVRPRAVRLIACRPKTRRRGNTYGSTAAWKKAYVKVDDVQALIATP